MGGDVNCDRRARVSQYFYRPNQVVPGTQLRIVRPLGSGGGGTVYVVWHEYLRQEYVLKVIHPELVLRHRDRVLREAAILARLRHDNIVRIHWADWTRDEPPLFFLVMEKLDGAPLNRVIARAVRAKVRLPLGFCIDTAAGVLQALVHAHEHGVLHRDVKPANIFIHRDSGSDAIPKLLDFGIGVFLSNGSTSPSFRGTHRYASPEQLTGGVSGPELRPASDIYSLGVVLYQMVTGRPPFEDRADVNALSQARRDWSMPCLSRWRPVPLALEQLVQQMLHRDAACRCSASDIAAVLAEQRRHLDANELDMTELRSLMRAESGSRAVMSTISGGQPENLSPGSDLEIGAVSSSPSLSEVLVVRHAENSYVAPKVDTANVKPRLRAPSVLHVREEGSQARALVAHRREQRGLPATILHFGDGLLMAEAGRVAIGIWRERSTMDRFLIQKACLEKVVRRHTGGAAFLLVIEETSQAPDDQVRRASAAMVTELGDDLKCAACVIVGTGFRAAVTRSVLWAITRGIKSSAPVKYFESVPTAAQWVSKYVLLDPMVPFLTEIAELRGLLGNPESARDSMLRRAYPVLA